MSLAKMFFAKMYTRSNVSRNIAFSYNWHRKTDLAIMDTTTLDFASIDSVTMDP